MKDFLIFLPITFIYLIIKSTILPSVPIPDVPLLIVFYIACSRASVEGAILSFVMGYVEDTFTAGVFGSTSFSLVFVFLLVHLLSMKMHFNTQFVRAGAASALTVVKGLLSYLLLSLTAFEAPLGARLVLIAVITGVFAPPLLTAFAWITALLTPRPFERQQD